MIDPIIRDALAGLSGGTTSGVLMTNQEAAAAIDSLRYQLRSARAVVDVVRHELGVDTADEARSIIANLKRGELDPRMPISPSL